MEKKQTIDDSLELFLMKWFIKPNKKQILDEIQGNGDIHKIKLMYADFFWKIRIRIREKTQRKLKKFWFFEIEFKYSDQSINNIKMLFAEMLYEHEMEEDYGLEKEWQ